MPGVVENDSAPAVTLNEVVSLAVVAAPEEAGSATANAIATASAEPPVASSRAFLALIISRT